MSKISVRTARLSVVLWIGFAYPVPLRGEYRIRTDDLLHAMQAL